jgi:hypothetical protein
MEVVENTRTRMVHLLEDGPEVDGDNRFRLLCGANIDADHLTFCAEPRDECVPCPKCEAHLSALKTRWNRLTKVSRSLQRSPR